MWSDISTPAAVTSNQEGFDGITYRLVLLDAALATQRVTDTEEEFGLIEKLVMNSHTKFAVSLDELHPLLSKPFMTKTHKGGSRFGSEAAGGIYYCALNLQTSAAERGYYVQRFLIDSLALESISQAHTQINVEIRAQVVDVRVAPFDQVASVFQEKNTYAKTQEFGAVVRQTDVQGIKYTSVRLRNGAACFALMTPAGFVKKSPTYIDSQWSCFATRELVRWTNPYASENGSPLSFEFKY